MTGRTRLRPAVIVAGIAIVAVLAFALVMSRGETGGDDAPRVSVVPGAGSPEADRMAEGPASNTMTAPLAGADPSPQIVQTLSEAFPALADVESRCDARECAVRATASEPQGGAALTAYEEMLRTGLATALGRAGVRMAGPLQIEELGGDRYRLLIRATPS